MIDYFVAMPFRWKYMLFAMLIVAISPSGGLFHTDPGLSMAECWQCWLKASMIIPWLAHWFGFSSSEELAPKPRVQPACAPREAARQHRAEKSCAGCGALCRNGRCDYCNRQQPQPRQSTSRERYYVVNHVTNDPDVRLPGDES